MTMFYASDPKGLGANHNERGLAVLEITDEDYDAFCQLPRRRGKRTAPMLDAASGIRFDVKPAACGLGCFCAAELVAVSA